MAPSHSRYSNIRREIHFEWPPLIAGILLDIGEVCEALLGGMVAICAPCASIHPWEALVIGAIGGLVTIGCEYSFFYKEPLEHPISFAEKKLFEPPLKF